MLRGTPMRRGVIFDSLPLWLEAIETTLRPLSVAVVHKATTWTEALRALEAQQPDLFVAEIDSDGSRGEALGALATAVERHPRMKVIAMSGDSDSATIESALARGASAVVMKSAHPDDLASAVRQVFDQSVYFARDARPPEAASTSPKPHSADMHPDAGELTRRELEILRHVANGRSNAELAKELWVTEQTVKFHLSNIYRKLGVRNRTQASLWAQGHRLTSRGSESSAA
jgi:DNA-binding NarL/FixJ family response regulator